MTKNLSQPYHNQPNWIGIVHYQNPKPNSKSENPNLSSPFPSQSLKIRLIYRSCKEEEGWLLSLQMNLDLLGRSECNISVLHWENEK
jgi:hypothetical protein